MIGKSGPVALAARLLVSSALAVAVFASVSTSGQALANSYAPELMPAAGQYVPVTPVEALDTRNGTGGVTQAPLSAGETVSFPVTGVGTVPASGVTDVFVDISAFGPSASGALEDYDADDTNPGIWTVRSPAALRRLLATWWRSAVPATSR